MKSHEFYFVDELAAKLRVNPMTIYRYLKVGKIHAHKMGREYRIPKNEFERFLAASKK